MATKGNKAGRFTGRAAGRERLLNAAERLFAEHGYQGVSVREIASAAGVSIGLITYFFGTKERLFQEVFERLVQPVKEQRQQRLDAFYREFGDGIPDLCRMLNVLLEPNFRQSRKSEIFRRLAGRSFVDRTPEVRRVMNKIYSPGSASSHMALRKCCPHLTDQEFYWRWMCYEGALQYVLADVGRVQAIVGAGFDTSDPDLALHFVAPFLAGGFLAPAIVPKAEVAAKRAAGSSRRKQGSKRPSTRRAPSH